MRNINQSVHGCSHFVNVKETNEAKINHYSQFSVQLIQLNARITEI